MPPVKIPPDKINIRAQVLGGHVHLHVFVNGAKSGELILRNRELDALARICAISDLTVTFPQWPTENPE